MMRHRYMYVKRSDYCCMDDDDDDDDDDDVDDDDDNREFKIPGRLTSRTADRK